MTAARAVLFKDAAITPLGRPVCDVVAVAKRDLIGGEKLDGIGGYMCFGVIENSNICENDKLLPVGLAEGCRLIKDVKKDQALTYRDVHLPKDRLIDVLRVEQHSYFSSSGTL